MAKIAVIGGTGVYNPKMLQSITARTVETPYGEVSYQTGEYAGKEVAFIPRHGSRHSIPPHLVNYRANIWAIKKIGATHVVSTTAVGSLNREMKPGDFVLADQFLDFTKGRVSTFFEGGERGVKHVDVTEPYCPQLRATLWQAAAELGLSAHNGGVYVCTEGPRFETAAEVKMFAQLGGDLVGMTNVPEVVLAREAELCYATISMVTNFGAGISPQALTHGEVVDIMKENASNLQALLMRAIERIDADGRDCRCGQALAEYGGFKL